MNEEKLHELTQKALEQLQAIHKELRDARGILGIFKAAPKVVARVESLGEFHGLLGSEKKALAVEIILNIVQLPWWAPPVIVRLILSYAIERAVSKLKKLVKKA